MSIKFSVGDSLVEFSHTAVNLDAHLFINNMHDPDLCPECIRPGILKFNNHDDSIVIDKITKSFGGCTKCYGKGYSTVKSQVIGYGTDGDIGGFEGKFKQDTPVQMKFCDCDRGQQLQGLINGK